MAAQNKIDGYDGMQLRLQGQLRGAFGVASGLVTHEDRAAYEAELHRSGAPERAEQDKDANRARKGRDGNENSSRKGFHKDIAETDKQADAKGRRLIDTILLLQAGASLQEQARAIQDYIANDAKALHEQRVAEMHAALDEREAEIAANVERLNATEGIPEAFEEQGYLTDEQKDNAAVEAYVEEYEQETGQAVDMDNDAAVVAAVIDGREDDINDNQRMSAEIDRIKDLLDAEDASYESLQEKGEALEQATQMYENGDITEAQYQEIVESAGNEVQIYAMEKYDLEYNTTASQLAAKDIEQETSPAVKSDFKLGL